MSPSHRNEPPPYPKYGDRPQDVPARYLRTLTNIVDLIKHLTNIYSFITTYYSFFISIIFTFLVK